MNQFKKNRYKKRLRVLTKLNSLQLLKSDKFGGAKVSI